MKNTEIKNGETKERENSMWVMRICLIIAVVLLILLMLRCCGSRKLPESIDDRPNTVDIRRGGIDDAVLEEMTDDEIVAELNRQVQQSMITMAINPEPTFRDGQGNLLIQNEETNQGPIVVEIKRSDIGTTIYTSPVVPLGKRVNSGTLDAELPVGDYPCTAYFHYVDEQTGEILGTGGVSVTVHIR